MALARWSSSTTPPSPRSREQAPIAGPDQNRWYNQPLTVRFHGSDATSQIAACTVARYAGPDNPSASIAGSCADRAGNSSGASAFPFRYDHSAPALSRVRVNAGNRRATLSWDASPDTNLVEIVRTTGKRSERLRVYRGTGRTFVDDGLENGVRYRYALTSYDEARNAATRVVVATPTGPLVSPRGGATVSAPPRLVWKAAEKATYYNVQVWRGGGRIFSVWPTGTSVELKRTWSYAGRRHRLTPGRYRWYVWAGYGRKAQNRFGPLLGSSSFVVALRGRRAPPRRRRPANTLTTYSAKFRSSHRMIPRDRDTKTACSTAASTLIARSERSVRGSAALHRHRRPRRPESARSEPRKGLLVWSRCGLEGVGPAPIALQK